MSTRVINMQRKHLVAISLVIIAISGCSADRIYTISPHNIEVINDGEDFNVSGEVILTGKFGDDLLVRGVQLRMYHNETMMQRVILGPMSQGNQRLNFSVITEDRPSKILIYHCGYEPQNYDADIVGLRWKSEENAYSEFIIDEPSRPEAACT